MRLYELLESLDKDQKRVGQVGGEENARKIGPVLGKAPKQHPFKGRLVGESAEKLHVGDPVIITGNVNFKGRTGDIVGFGKDNKFVIVDLYNYGRHSFHSSDVSYNDYADEDNLDEDKIQEVAPPGMEKWIKDRKADFKERYGKRWKEVLYATAWKRHKNESVDEAQVSTMRRYFAGDKNAQDELKITQMRQYFDDLLKKEEERRRKTQELQKGNVTKIGSK